jgi:hypothetical protein
MVQAAKLVRNPTIWTVCCSHQDIQGGKLKQREEERIPHGATLGRRLDNIDESQKEPQQEGQKRKRVAMVASYSSNYFSFFDFRKQNGSEGYSRR